MSTSNVRRRGHHQRTKSIRASLSSSPATLDPGWELTHKEPVDTPLLELDEHPDASSRSRRTSISTLVNPAPPVKLIFDRNSVLNATLYSNTGPVYRIKTSLHVTRTDIWDLAEQTIVATWKRREFRPDVVVFAHRRKKAVRLRKWLKKRKIPGEGQMAELRTQIGRFTWRSDMGHRFKLYTNDETTFPIAHGKPLQEPRTLFFIMKEGQPRNLQIEALMSYVVLEHRIRMKEKRWEAQLHHILGMQLSL